MMTMKTAYKTYIYFLGAIVAGLLLSSVLPAQAGSSSALTPGESEQIQTRVSILPQPLAELVIQITTRNGLCPPMRMPS